MKFRLPRNSSAEFLLAQNKEQLFEYLKNFAFEEIPLVLHEQLTNLFKEYLLIGGLPAAVLNWSKELFRKSTSNSK